MFMVISGGQWLFQSANKYFIYEQVGCTLWICCKFCKRKHAALEEEGKNLVIVDQVGTPTCAVDLAGLFRLSSKSSSAGCVSLQQWRGDFLGMILQGNFLNYQPLQCRVKPLIDDWYPNWKAIRPVYSVMD
jgi:hypothetical protein